MHNNRLGVGFALTRRACETGASEVNTKSVDRPLGRQKRSKYQDDGDAPRPLSLRRKKALTALAIRAFLI